ncbi:hypothetical protein DICA1_D21462 [Diutina catenulata]
MVADSESSTTMKLLALLTISAKAFALSATWSPVSAATSFEADITVAANDVNDDYFYGLLIPQAYGDDIGVGLRVNNKKRTLAYGTGCNWEGDSSGCIEYPQDGEWQLDSEWKLSISPMFDSRDQWQISFSTHSNGQHIGAAYTYRANLNLETVKTVMQSSKPCTGNSAVNFMVGFGDVEPKFVESSETNLSDETCVHGEVTQKGKSVAFKRSKPTHEESTTKQSSSTSSIPSKTTPSPTTSASTIPTVPAPTTTTTTTFAEPTTSREPTTSPTPVQTTTSSPKPTTSSMTTTSTTPSPISTTSFKPTIPEPSPTPVPTESETPTPVKPPSTSTSAKPTTTPTTAPTTTVKSTTTTTKSTPTITSKPNPTTTAKPTHTTTSKPQPTTTGKPKVFVTLIGPTTIVTVINGKQATIKTVAPYVIDANDKAAGEAWIKWFLGKWWDFT